MADAEIRMIHENAVKRASDDDQIWFRENPGRNFRIRDLMPYEFNGKIDDPPDGYTWRTIIAQISEGARIRLPATLPKETPNEGAQDDELVRIFGQVAPNLLSRLQREP
jgi:hypothetical protein|tara:strand:+ start:1393 stop:1719 length:327 start_codon:yes stop_codon:yes gene_type:complete